MKRQTHNRPYRVLSQIGIVGIMLLHLGGCVGKNTVSSQGPWAIKSENRFAYEAVDWKVFGTDHFITQEYVSHSGSVLAGTAVTRRSTIQHNARYFCFVYDTSPTNLFDGWSRSWPVWRGVGWNRGPSSFYALKPYLPPVDDGDVRIFYSQRMPFTTGRGHHIDPTPEVIIYLPEITATAARRDFKGQPFLVRVLNNRTRRYSVAKFLWARETYNKYSLQMTGEDHNVPFLWTFLTEGDTVNRRGITVEIYAVSSEDWKTRSYQNGDRFYNVDIPSVPDWTIDVVREFFE
ncbi:MAG: hypothetical protein AAF750_10650 [Planctomycetota bacterium]